MNATVRTVHFTIEGVWFTDHVRELVAEGRWRLALQMLLEGLPGMTYEQALSILRGEKRLEGENDLLMVDEDPEREEVADWRRNMTHIFAGLLQEPGDAKFWMPRAVVTGYGPQDLRGPKWEPDADLVIPVYVSGRRAPVKDRRALHYADPGEVAHEVGGKFGPQTVLFSPVPDPAPWLPTVRTPEESVEAFQAAGRHLEETGWSVVYGTLDGTGYEEGGAVREAMRRGRLYGSEVEADERERRRRTEGDVMRSLLADMPADLQKAAAGTLRAISGELEEEANTVPEEDPTFHQDNGYITRSGAFYGCDFHGHAALADRLLRLVERVEVTDPEKDADARGWVRLSKGVGPFLAQCRKKPTRAQLLTLVDFCNVHAFPFPTELAE